MMHSFLEPGPLLPQERDANGFAVLPLELVLHLICAGVISPMELITLKPEGSAKNATLEHGLQHKIALYVENIILATIPSTKFA